MLLSSSLLLLLLRVHPAIIIIITSLLLIVVVTHITSSSKLHLVRNFSLSLILSLSLSNCVSSISLLPPFVCLSVEEEEEELKNDDDDERRRRTKEDRQTPWQKMSIDEEKKVHPPQKFPRRGVHSSSLNTAPVEQALVEEKSSKEPDFRFSRRDCQRVHGRMIFKILEGEPLY